MNTTTQEEILERRAALVRERLLTVVDELDRKRHNLTAPVQLAANVKIPKPAFVAVLAGAGVAAVAAIAFAISRLRARTPLQRRASDLPRGAGIARSAAKILLSFAAVQGGKAVFSRATHALRPH